MATTQFTGFPKETIKFLKDLSSHNDRDWFQEHKDRYEAGFLNPSLEFIEAMQAPLSKISPFLQAIPKKMGGSLMRIYRDIRFSPNKDPYKTNIGIHFRHEAGSSVHAPGFYVHIEPNNVFLGAGVWRPDKEPLAMIREAIAEDPSRWKRVRDQKKFRSQYELTGESLKRPPAGFDKEHPLIEDIKRKDFIAIRNLPTNEIHEFDFHKQVLESFKLATPWMRYLCEVIDLPY